VETYIIFFLLIVPEFQVRFQVSDYFPVVSASDSIHCLQLDMQTFHDSRGQRRLSAPRDLGSQTIIQDNIPFVGLSHSRCLWIQPTGRQWRVCRSGGVVDEEFCIAVYRVNIILMFVVAHGIDVGCTSRTEVDLNCQVWYLINKRLVPLYTVNCVNLNHILVTQSKFCEWLEPMLIVYWWALVSKFRLAELASGLEDSSIRFWTRTKCLMRSLHIIVQQLPIWGP